jgi:predicted AAA+ superfamily ATPase
VRRRLFEPLADQAQFKDRDVVARAFAELYRTQHQEFPPECRDADYEKRIKAAYPIHPEIFDRLYTGLVHVGQVSAHTRRAAPDGRSDS